MAKSFEFYTLKNGVKVVLVPMKGVESVACGVYVKTGSRYETPAINGISHFLEHMAFKGTKHFPTYKEVHYLEGLGAIQNAWTAEHATAYWCKIPADKWKDGLAVVKDLALYPTIPEKELELERGVILEEIKMYDDKPEVVVGEKAQQMLYTGNGLGMRISGEPRIIKRLRRQDFVDYHKSHYTASAMVVVLAGKLPKEDMGKWFEEVERGGQNKYISPKLPQSKPRVEIVERKVGQAHVDLILPGINMKDPRRYALSVLTAILGHGATSRLFGELREKRGLCYAIGASASRYEDVGDFGIYAGLNVQYLAEAVKAILEQMEKVKNVRVGDKELQEAKEKIRGPLLFSMENPAKQMDYYANQVLGRPEEVIDYDVLIDRLMEVTAEEVQRIAQDLFKSEKLNLAMVGPLPMSQKDKLLRLLKI